MRNASRIQEPPLFQFLWTAPIPGYRWAPGQAGDPELVEVATPPREVREYAPLAADNPVFLHFADAAPTEDGYLEFANSFGALGISRREIPRAVNGEPLSTWKQEHAHLTQAVRLWRAALENDLQALRSVIRWTRSSVVYETDQFGQAFTRTASPVIYSRLRHGQLVQPAWHFLQSMVNQAIRARVAPQLLWHDEKLRLYFRPDSLRAAMWLQLARAIAGKAEYRRCEICSAWFELKPGVNRADKRLCTDACKMVRYRREKARKQK